MSLTDGTEELDAPLDAPRGPDETRTNLIVNYLPQSMSDNELFSMFVTCGPLQQAKIMRDRATDYSFGYGFVHYQNPNDAARAIKNLNGLQVQHKTIKVSYSRPSTPAIKDTNLYVANLGPTMTDEKMSELFEPYGKILTLNLLKEPESGESRGFGFIRYAKKEEADEAIANVAGTLVPGQTKPIVVKVAEEHGKQKAQFFAGVMQGMAGMGPPGRGRGGGGFGRGGFGGGAGFGGFGGGGGGYGGDFGPGFGPGHGFGRGGPGRFMRGGRGGGFSDFGGGGGGGGPMGGRGARGRGNRFNPMAAGAGAAGRGGRGGFGSFKQDYAEDEQFG